MRQYLIVRSSLAIAPIALVGAAATSGCGSSAPQRPEDLGVVHEARTSDPEALCEAELRYGWTTSLPSLGFASNAAAQLIDQAISSELSKPGLQHPQWPGGNWPAVSIAVTHGSHLVFAKTYGFADMESPQLAHPDNLFRLASNSKQLTGVTILKLIHDGQTVDGVTPLTLQTQVFPVLTTGQNPILPPPGQSLNPALQNITVEEVLHHTGGWAFNIGDPVWYANQPNAVFPVTLDAPVSAMMPLLPTFSPPGQISSYSNFGYNLLAAFIEKITGQDYETVVKTKVLAPLGITHAQVGHSLKSQIADNEVHYSRRPGPFRHRCRCSPPTRRRRSRARRTFRMERGRSRRGAAREAGFRRRSTPCAFNSVWTAAGRRSSIPGFWTRSRRPKTSLRYSGSVCSHQPNAEANC